jgi:hypothetical protein
MSVATLVLNGKRLIIWRFTAPSYQAMRGEDQKLGAIFACSACGVIGSRSGGRAQSSATRGEFVVVNDVRCGRRCAGRPAVPSRIRA